VKPENCFRNLQLKFFLYGDPLLSEEESRIKHLSSAQQVEPDPSKRPGWVDFAVYMAEIDFDNITHLSYELNERDEIQMLISVRRPVGVRKRLREQVNSVRSPFNMHSENQFLNYWNVK
jgi:hypothetical protein